MNNKIATALRIIYSTGLPFLFMFIGGYIETVYSLIAFFGLIMIYILTSFYENYKDMDLMNIRAFEMRLSIWTLNLCIAPFMTISIGGGLIYIFLFIITLITVGDNDSLLEIGEGIFLGFLSDKRFAIMVLLFIAFFIYVLFTQGFEGLIHFHFND
jgi:hypothetical protein